MVQCSQVKEDKSSCSWQRLASHKDPLRLGTLSQSCVSKASATAAVDVHNWKDNLRNVCQLLNTSFPLNVRTAVVEEIVSAEDIKEPQQVISIILLHLLTDVKSFTLTTGVKNGGFIHLEKEDCDFLLKELDGTHNFHLESLRLEGVCMRKGVLSEILRRSPRIHSIRISGEMCQEVLTHLEKHRRSLHSLQLDNSTVTDREVVRGLLGSKYDFETLGNIICEGNGEKVQSIPHHLLCHLSVESHFVTACGGMVLIHFLPQLRTIRYSPSVFDTLLALQRISPVQSSFSLKSMELWSPSDVNLISLQKCCPELKHLMIECHDPSLKSLEELSVFTELTSLTLRLIPEELILSAVKATGRNLQRLNLEFETSTCISLETIKTVQENCPNLQALEMHHVCIEIKPGDRLPSFKTVLLAKLKQLNIYNSVIHPAVLERLLVGNNSLENLVLDVNKEALTDQMLETLLKHNRLDKIISIFLGSGSLSIKAITSLISLPALTRLSLNLQSFPLINGVAFSTLQKSLTKGNFHCVLEEVVIHES